MLFSFCYIFTSLSFLSFSSLSRVSLSLPILSLSLPVRSSLMLSLSSLTVSFLALFLLPFSGFSGGVVVLCAVATGGEGNPPISGHGDMQPPPAPFMSILSCVLLLCGVWMRNGRSKGWGCRFRPPPSFPSPAMTLRGAGDLLSSRLVAILSMDCFSS